MKKFALLPVAFCLFFHTSVHGSQLVSVSLVNRDYLCVKFVDGEVKFVDDGKGEGAFETINDPQNNILITYGVPLDLAACNDPANWKITSNDDNAYGKQGLNALSCFRKSKPNGLAQFEWNKTDYHYEVTMEHTIYVRLPQPLQDLKTYTLHINPSTNTHLSSETFTFDVFNRLSGAIHVNLAGYSSGTEIKACDLYQWLGDGGSCDFSAYENNKVWLYNTQTKKKSEAGLVAFWKKAAIEQGYYDHTAADVWNADVKGTCEPGNYRIVIDGVGCSQDFTISQNVYFEPFRISTLGFFYMRIGQDSSGIRPVPRRPLYIPGKSPENTRVYITSMNPYHTEWKTFSRGDVWDRPEDWSRYTVEGRMNTVVHGGHSDALDWDRHLGHISIIYDMLLPYILTKGKLSDDNLGIAESGNGIPDLLDEARNEVDFWLMLRDGKGYSHGISCPDRENRFYQAANTAMAAWANAANSSMLAVAFKYAGLTELMQQYRDSALNAYNFAMKLPDKMLDKSQNVGDIDITGTELRLLADACLYTVTGDQTYERDLNKNSRIKSNESAILGKHMNELWSTAVYLMTDQKIHFPQLYAFMKNSIIREAEKAEAGYISVRPSRRSTDEATGQFKTEQNVHRTIIAHAITDNMQQKQEFEKALYLEADWGLGRNPLNMIQMTTATTVLEGKNSVENAYTSGRDDGTPGMHPGHTPYLNTNDWGKGMVMHMPGWLTAKCYPEYTKWPKSEGYFNTRYVWSHSEFTPQQTMRGKMALYGYLYGLSKG
jgi:hypothetical protein